MLLTSQMQPTFSLALAFMLFSLNMHCPAYAKTDGKRRQRHFLKILTSTEDKYVRTKNDNSTTHGLDSTHLSRKGHSLLETSSTQHRTDDSTSDNGKELLKITGSDRKTREHASDKDSKVKKREPSIVGGSDTKLTLTLMSKFKRTWCKTEPFLQRIKEPGCISRRVMNRFCYGQCNSFYIPRTLRKRTKRKVFKSCGFCRPNRMNTIHVTLKCPGKKKGYKHKKVKQVKHCRCMER